MAYQFHSLCILVVEDSQPMLDITKNLLLVFGVGRVLTASEGETGFQKYKENNPDIVLCDWMMKPMDGISLARRIRTDPKSPNPYVPIILMSGFTERRRIFQARDCGITEFLAKPFTARDLYKRIHQIVERPRQFVRSGYFFGPDRRRHSDRSHTGPFRREDDPAMQAGARASAENPSLPSDPSPKE